MGPCSFDDPKTVDREACQQSGLLENDRHHNEAQTEVDVARSPSALRSLFAVILAMYEPSDSFQLWTAPQENLCEPLTRPTDGYFASKLLTAQNKMIRYLLNYGCRRHIGFSDFKKSNCLDINARVDSMSLNLMFNIF